MKRTRKAFFYYGVTILIGLMSICSSPRLNAQKRLNDKDVEAMMRNLRDDAKDFRPKFESALKKSTIRKTSQEKDAKSMVVTFEKQADAMLSEFKKSKKGDVAVETTLNNAQEIDRMIYSLQLSPQITSQWEKLRTELDRLSSAFGITVHSGSRMQ
jgi:single-stranded DNA-specific DHH superfamily exonuclease